MLLLLLPCIAISTRTCAETTCRT